MYILSVDPGFSSVGWALCEISQVGSIDYIGSGVIRTKKATAKVLVSEDNVSRAREIAAGIMEIFVDMDAHPSRLKAIVSEAQSWPRNASVSAKVGMCWGILASFAHACEIPLVQVSPQSLKKRLTGRRGASKQDVADAVCEFWPQVRVDAECYPVTQREHMYDAAAALLASRDSDVISAMISVARHENRSFFGRN